MAQILASLARLPVDSWRPGHNSKAGTGFWDT